MKQLIYIVNIGTELRHLVAIEEVYRNFKIIFFARNSIISEVEKFLENKGNYEIHAVDTFSPEYKKISARISEHLLKMVDSLARRVNLEKGISSFSYSRKNINRIHSNNYLKNMASRLLLRPTLCTTKVFCRLGMKNKNLQNILESSGAERILFFDHLGSNDYLSFNASLAGLQVEYYLNNQKDITIRPYAPLSANKLYIWSDCQMDMFLNVCSTYDKLETIESPRITKMKKYLTYNTKKNSSFTILHCCSDPCRKPYEIYTLKNIFDSILEKNINIEILIRINPMDKSGIFDLLKKYPFITIIPSEWYWDKNKFLNFPTEKNEKEYVRLIEQADMITTLPSSVIIEGILLGKEVCCIVDEHTPDYEYEIREIDSVIPKQLQKSKNFHLIKNTNEYLETMKRIKRA